MRTDHVTAWLIKLWLEDHFPQLAEHWNLTVSDQVKGFAQKIETIIPRVRWIFVSQNILAHTAIEMWNLENVVLLAGGTPTPLTPSPERLLYFTDANPEAVAEAEEAGYTAAKVDVTSGQDFTQLEGAESLIATGLLHFLPDSTAQSLFQQLDHASFHTFAFSQATPEADREAIEQYQKLGIDFYVRSEDELRALLPPGWEINYRERVVDVMQQAGEVGAQLADTPHMVDFYKISREEAST